MTLNSKGIHFLIYYDMTWCKVICVEYLSRLLNLSFHQEKQGLDELLKELLDAGQIQEAFKLASVFQHYNRNLAIIRVTKS